MFVNLGPRLGLRIQQEMILEAQQVDIRQDAALGIQEEPGWWSWRAAAGRGLLRWRESWRGRTDPAKPHFPAVRHSHSLM
jgi:hypothetical protein